MPDQDSALNGGASVPTFRGGDFEPGRRGFALQAVAGAIDDTVTIGCTPQMVALTVEEAVIHAGHWMREPVIEPDLANRVAAGAA